MAFVIFCCLSSSRTLRLSFSFSFIASISRRFLFFSSCSSIRSFVSASCLAIRSFSRISLFSATFILAIRFFSRDSSSFKAISFFLFSFSFLRRSLFSLIAFVTLIFFIFAFNSAFRARSLF